MEANREYFRAVSVFTNYEVSSVGRIRNSKTGRILKLRTRKDGYLDVCLSKNGTTKRFLVHRLVAEAFFENPAGKRTVDHIDSDQKNNCLSNLRFATHSENSMNKRMPTNMSSRYKGVWIDKRRNKWIASIKVNGKAVFLGYFANEREAGLAYNLAAVKYFKNFAKLNIFDD